MQQYLVWTIILSFENNLFAFLMMVAGGVKVLLAFSLVTTIANLILNSVLVESFGLAGGCLVIILTKLVMMTQTFVYCRFRFSFIREKDFIFPIVLAGFSFAVYQFLKPYTTIHPAVLITLGFYFLILWQFGTKFLGPRPRKIG
jgi:O-antigen/teichoic acid export membrane protein